MDKSIPGGSVFIFNALFTIVSRKMAQKFTTDAKKISAEIVIC
jgi:hypothetical protein